MPQEGGGPLGQPADLWGQGLIFDNGVKDQGLALVFYKMLEVWVPNILPDESPARELDLELIQQFSTFWLILEILQNLEPLFCHLNREKVATLAGLTVVLMINHVLVLFGHNSHVF